MQEVLKFPRSDGDSSCWPACGHPKDGEHWERLENDNDVVTQYLDKLSTQLSDQFGRPHIIHSLPDGYALFIKYTMNGSRQDRYLVGSRHVKRFRSPAEFAPHALWLLNDPSLECTNCLCKYCGKKPARTVKHSESIISRPTIQAPSTRAQRVSRTSSSLTQISRSSVGKEAKRLFRVLKAPPDLDAMDPQPSPSDAKESSFYREGEIVWLVLNKPVMFDYSDGAMDGFVIRFWPCIVEMGEDYENPLAVPYGHQLSVDAPLRVRLLSSGIVYHVAQRHTLPFWAHSPDGLWIQRLRLQTQKSLPDIQDPFTGFSRVFGSQSGEETVPTLNTGDLLSSFLRDIEISSEIVRSWSTSPRTPPQSGGEPAPTSPHAPIVSALCHELWWGAERITFGDLIRLRIPESKLRKLGADQIWFIPGAFSEQPAEANPVSGSEVEDGQLFFKLRSLAIVEGRDGKALHGFGGLYRLVPASPGLLPPLAEDRHPLLPPPPEGFIFQPVLRNGWEVELSMHYIDGRYYPRIQEFLPESSGADAYVLEVLEGLLCWRNIPSRPLYFKKTSREEVVARAIAEVEGRWISRG